MALFRVLPRRAWALLSVWAASFALLHLGHSAVSWRFFAFGGRVLARAGVGGGLHTYAAHPVLQIGPIALLAASGLDLLGHVGRLAAVILLAAEGLVLVGIIGTTRIGGVVPSQRRLLAAATVFLPVWMELAFHYAHLDDGLALLFAALAVRAAADERGLAAGVFLALAVDSKPWAAAFVPLLLVVPRARRSAAAVACAAGVAAAGLPFVLADARTLAAAGFRIPITATSALRVLGVTGSSTPSWDRPAQLVGGALLALAAVRTGRWPAVLFAAIAVRILIDPGTYAYYTSGLVLAALYVDLFLVRSRVPVYAAAAGVAIYAVRATPIDFAALGALRAGYCLVAAATLFQLRPVQRSGIFSSRPE
jgi:hypothetical protein